MSNQDKFDEVRALGLPLGRYVITASGPMGIRGIRDIDDVDLLVVESLFDELAARHPTDGHRIRISPTIEAFAEYAFPQDPSMPGLTQQIEQPTSSTACLRPPRRPGHAQDRAGPGEGPPRHRAHPRVQAANPGS